MKRLLLALLFGLTLLALAGYWLYGRVYKPITAFDQGKLELLIPTGCDFDCLENLLLEKKVITNRSSFRWLSNKKSFTTQVKAGRYLIEKGSNLNQIINKLRSGDQSPVRLVVPGARLPENIAGRVARYIEADSLELLRALHDPENAQKFGFDTESFRAMIIPNTYEFWWNTSAEDFLQRMAKEFKSFWNENRRAKAMKMGLSQSEVSTLASIVKAECSKKDEAPRIAGVYVNRLKRGIALQADPTLIYALGDFSINRVLDVHKEIASPYNTYLNAGLPPGPINYPEPQFIDAVLQYENHDYLYFCAKPDFSGYHNFAKSYNQHLQNAKAYQRELNKRRIYR